MIRLARTLSCLLIFLTLFAIGSTALAAPEPTELRTFFDEMVPALMLEHDVPGVSLAVVADGENVLLAGYGAARLEPYTSATATTPFATGSVSKLLTAAAVMLQVERGLLDLDADVNDYLRGKASFVIPEAFGAPVRVRHLLSHTAGFEDWPQIGLFTAPGAEVVSLAVALGAGVPQRVKPPGTEAAYSNYSSALAGYLVSLSSGLSFAEFVAREIFEPLGMQESTFRQPYPDDIEQVVTYQYVATGDGEFELTNRDYVPLAPAGALVMSARDAARFMLMHLGSAPGPLSAETLATMKETLHHHHPELPGNAHGFWQSDRNGQSILSHQGDTSSSHALLALLPDERLGVYLSTNANGGAVLREELWGAFLDRFYPAAPPAIADSVDLTQYGGTFLPNRYSTSTFPKAVLLLSGLKTRTEAGPLVTPSPRGTGDVHWLPLGSDWFVDPATDTRMFIEMTDGQAQAAYLSEFPFMVFHRAKWHENPMLHIVVTAAALLLFLISAVALPIIWVRRRRRNAAGPALPITLNWTLSVLALISTGTLVVAILNPKIVYGVSTLMVVGLTLGLVVAVLAVLSVASAGLAWANSWWSAGLRVYATVIALAGAVFTAFLAYWNLLGYRY